jgi:hypothetical protein
MNYQPISILAGDLEQCVARIDERDAEVLAPADVAARGERLDELALVVEKAREGVGPGELVAVGRRFESRQPDYHQMLKYMRSTAGQD